MTNSVNGQISVFVRTRPNTANEQGNLVENLDERILIFDPPVEKFFNNENQISWQEQKRSQSAGPSSIKKPSTKATKMTRNRPSSVGPSKEPARKGVPSNPLLKTRGRTRHKEHKFAFDNVFNQFAGQDTVYEKTVQPLIDKVFDGYNCSCFCYGATGAGKTYTMSGTNTKPGIMYRAVQDIYQKIKNQSEKEFDVYVTFCEVYNERVHDLLKRNPNLDQRTNEITKEEPKNSRPKSALKNRRPTSSSSTSAAVTEESRKKPKYEKDLRPDLQVLERNGKVEIPDLALVPAPEVERLMSLLNFGNNNRTQHATDANAQSSRSHAIFTIILRQKEKTAKINSTARMSKLVLVDLAGSERAAKVTAGRGASRLREGANINKSLLALGSVINALADKAKNKGSKSFVNYRNSKLTRIIKDVLGGNCFTVMIANVSGDNRSYDDTWNTLCYANRAKNIKANVTKSEFNVTASIAHYKDIATKQAEEIAKLKEKLKRVQDSKDEIVLMKDQEIDSLKQLLSKKGGMMADDNESENGEKATDSMSDLESYPTRDEDKNDETFTIETPERKSANFIIDRTTPYRNIIRNRLNSPVPAIPPILREKMCKVVEERIGILNKAFEICSELRTANFGSVIRTINNTGLWVLASSSILFLKYRLLFDNQSTIKFSPL